MFGEDTYAEYLAEVERLNAWAIEQGMSELTGPPLSEDRWREDKEWRDTRKSIMTEEITSLDQVRTILEYGFNIEGPDSDTVSRVIDFLLKRAES